MPFDLYHPHTLTPPAPLKKHLRFPRSHSTVDYISSQAPSDGTNRLQRLHQETPSFYHSVTSTSVESSRDAAFAPGQLEPVYFRDDISVLRRMSLASVAPRRGVVGRSCFTGASQHCSRPRGAPAGQNAAAVVAQSDEATKLAMHRLAVRWHCRSRWRQPAAIVPTAAASRARGNRIIDERRRPTLTSNGAGARDTPLREKIAPLATRTLWTDICWVAEFMPRTKLNSATHSLRAAKKSDMEKS